MEGIAEVYLPIEENLDRNFKLEFNEENVHKNSDEDSYKDDKESVDGDSDRDEESVDGISDRDEKKENHNSIESEIKQECNSDSSNKEKTYRVEKDLSKYPCNLCDEIFDSYANLREHRKGHYLKKRTCNLCGLVCLSVSKLADHKNSHLGLKPATCDECGKSYSSTTQLKIHRRIHTDEKRYKCDQCDEAFRYNSTLKSHIRRAHTKILENTCKVCSKYCTTPEELTKHKATAHPKRPNKTFSCQLCAKVFKTEQMLSCHLKVHKELKFPCEICQRIYPSLYRLKKHFGRAHIPNICECKKVFYDRSEFTKHNKEFHKTEETTVCDFCSKTFDKPKNLQEHIRLQHKGNGKVNKCSNCGKEFINASLLRNHVKIHDKTFKCEYCDKIFGSRYNLQTHLVVHTKERNYKCDICGNHFGTKTALKNHQYTHSNERNFTCAVCGKSFKSNHRLYSHKFSHETEKKYECEVCSAKFTLRQYLNFHMKRHSTEKPFECRPCKKRFKHKRSYEKHCLLDKHKTAELVYEEENQCEYCDEKFATENCLMQHMAEDHGMGVTSSGMEEESMQDDEFDRVGVEVKVEVKMESDDSDS